MRGLFFGLFRHTVVFFKTGFFPGTPGRSYPVSGISYEKIVQKKDPGNNPKSARSPRTCLIPCGACSMKEFFYFSSPGIS